MNVAVLLFKESHKASIVVVICFLQAGFRTKATFALKCIHCLATNVLQHQKYMIVLRCLPTVENVLSMRNDLAALLFNLFIEQLWKYITTKNTKN